MKRGQATFSLIVWEGCYVHVHVCTAQCWVRFTVWYLLSIANATGSHLFTNYPFKWPAGNVTPIIVGVTELVIMKV